MESETDQSLVYEETVESVFSVHGVDKNDARILGFTFNSPRSMLTISTVLGIPIAECYRRANKLMSLHLLSRMRLSELGADGKNHGKDFYFANPEMVEVVVVNGRSKVNVRRNGVPDGSVFQFGILF
ncbi:MAG: hypothetical protein E3J35_00430 [Methanomassiliicoccales archaeon]|nr:MAG: hypothetical protein E3J35_00430 [Methanomassiliicoccales archaeon]